ncbi:conserved hypothetical protein [delta proteobacterium NaphS2]|nr:conserved hypothetical protein [delta proteobacterium NaphS2]
MGTPNKIKKEMKVMKKILTGSMIVLMVLFLSAGLGLAGNGNGVGGGTGPINNILLGEPFDYLEVEVMDIVSSGAFVVDTADGEITIYGIGPDRYWESLEVYKPIETEIISVIGYVVVYDGDERHIATSITVGDVTVKLRDLETGLPLWRGQKKGQVQE